MAMPRLLHNSVERSSKEEHKGEESKAPEHVWPGVVRTEVRRGHCQVDLVQRLVDHVDHECPRREHAEEAVPKKAFDRHHAEGRGIQMGEYHQQCESNAHGRVTQ
eukprot:scaffold32157_cov31-Tisochrysis_lutea.AAC.3